MIVSSYGILKKEEVANIVAKKMGINPKSISFKYITSNEIKASFDIETNDDFGVVETFAYNYAELLEMAKTFLKNKGYDVLKFETVGDYTPGASYEMLDYGSTEFVGFKFYFEAKKPA